MNNDDIRHDVAMSRAVMLSEFIRAMHTERILRERIERERSVHRNRNRVLVVLVAWIATLAIPVIANAMVHSVTLATYAPSIGFSADLLVTAYAWRRRY